MKSRLLLLVLFGIILFILVTKNNHGIRNSLIGFINPIKSSYRNFVQNITDKSQSYLFQKEQIEKLSKENRVLRKYLLDQTHYIRQVSTLYKAMPTLQKLPYKVISLVDTISYVKLNKFNEVILSYPKKLSLKSNKAYGLIQDEFVSGVAQIKQGILYGYLLSNPKCKFSVYTGPKRYPGIAMGVGKKLMAVKYIPKWAKIDIGERVETSGLDGIFFAYIPVGKVVRVVIEDGYKTAYIRPYADTIHPRLFFLITDTTPYLVSSYDRNRTFPGNIYPYSKQMPLDKDKNLSSIPEAVQTKELQIDPSEFEIPKELDSNNNKQNDKKKRETSKIPSKKPPKHHRYIPKIIKPIPEKLPQKKLNPSFKVAPPPSKPKRHPSPFDIFNSTRP